MKTQSKTERNEAIVQGLLAGVSQTNIALKYGLTRERVRQIGGLRGVSGASMLAIRNKKIVKLLRQRKLTLKEIGDELGCKESLIRRVRHERGVTVPIVQPKKRLSEHHRAILELVKSGLRYRQIVDKVGGSENMVSRVARDNGLRRNLFRPHGEQRGDG